MAIAHAAPISVQEAVEAALANDPNMVAVQAELDAADALRRFRAGPRFNPQLSLFLAGDLSQTNGALTLPLSLSGEGIQARKASNEQVASLEFARTRRSFEIAANIRVAYARVAMAGARVRIAEAQLEGATQVREHAEANARKGRASSAEPQLARLEEARILGVWLRATNELTNARAAFLRATGLEVDVELSDDPLDAAEGLGGEPGASDRSDVLAAKRAVKAAERDAATQRAATFAPANLGVFYEWDLGRFIIGPTLTVELPILKQNQAGRGAALAAVQVAEEQARAVTSQAAAERLSLIERHEAAERAVSLLTRDLEADAQTALESLSEAYSLGDASLNQVLLLKAQIMDGELGWYQAREALALTRIEIALAAEDPDLLASDP